MKDRNDIDNKYKWNLELIYTNKDLFEKDYLEVNSRISEFSSYNEIMLNSGKNLYNTYYEFYSIARMLNKLLIYSNSLFDLDTSNNDNQELKNRVSNLYEKLAKVAYFVSPNLLKLNQEKLNQYYKDFPKLEEFRVVLTNDLRFKEHTLSDEEEKLLSSLSKTLGNNCETYELLSDSDMKFDKIKLGDKKIELTDEIYSKCLYNKNRNVRRAAFTTLYKTYKQFTNTYSAILENNIKEEITLAKIKKYPSALEESLYREEVDSKVYHNLIEVVDNNLDKLHKYYSLKKEILNLKELHIYDSYVSLVGEMEKEYNYEYAKENVINALSIMGKEYIDIVKKAFDSRWIDVYPLKSKRSGGYSSGCYDTVPYILLNYNDEYTDMSTLAHELGHSVHSYYSRKYNTYQDSDYSLFVAEVASTVNEILLSKYMLEKSSSEEEKLYIINKLMETYKSTIYRQAMFAEFERDIYAMSEKDIPLTSKTLCNKYYELNKKYYGDSVVVDDEIRYEWERVPHFYYNFYVYKYSTGLSAANYIVENIILKGKKEDYINFLKVGGKLNPIESLKVAGVDLTDKKVFESAQSTFEDLVTQFSNSYRTIKKSKQK